MTIENEVCSDISTIDKESVSEPPSFMVLLHNDDYTTMEFVVEILRSIFHKNKEQAVLIMNHVHNKGIGRVGMYTEEIAETKVYQVEKLARSKGFPLRCTMEEV